MFIMLIIFTMLTILHNLLNTRSNCWTGKPCRTNTDILVATWKWWKKFQRISNMKIFLDLRIWDLEAKKGAVVVALNTTHWAFWVHIDDCIGLQLYQVSFVIHKDKNRKSNRFKLQYLSVPLGLVHLPPLSYDGPACAEIHELIFNKSKISFKTFLVTNSYFGEAFYLCMK